MNFNPNTRELGWGAHPLMAKTLVLSSGSFHPGVGATGPHAPHPECPLCPIGEILACPGAGILCSLRKPCSFSFHI